MTNTISIPDGYFLKSIQREYSDYKTALWRELIQNSRDAKASRIDVTISEDGFRFQDNGRGMNHTVLVEGMYALGGSVKDADAVGGFGQAKNIVTLCHDQHSIRTQDLLSTGSGINYDIQEGLEYFHGTVVTAKVNSNYGWSVSEQIGRLERVILRSELPNIQFFINGVQYHHYSPKGRKVGRGCRDWCSLYSLRTDYNVYSIAVRVNGVYMFDQYLPGDGIKRKLTIELQGDTKQLLTSNRDGLRQEYQNSLGEIMADILQNSSAFKAKKPRRFVYRGENGGLWFQIKQMLVEQAEIPTDVVRELDFQTIEDSLEDQTISQGEHVEAVIETITKQLDELGHVESVERIASMVSEVRENVETVFNNTGIQHDFLIDLADSNYQNIPVKYQPGQMGKRAEKLAKLWKYAIQTVMELDGRIEGAYQIGFKFDKDQVACRENADRPIYWMNPDSERFEFTKMGDLAISVLQVACHEVAHHYVDTHNEAFINKSEDLFMEIVQTIRNFNAWAKEAMEIEI